MAAEGAGTAGGGGGRLGSGRAASGWGWGGSGAARAAAPCSLRRAGGIVRSPSPGDLAQRSATVLGRQLAFRLKLAEHLLMSPRAHQQNPTAGALRAAKAIQNKQSDLALLPELIDRETGVREVLEILESIIAQAGDLIESRSPELVAMARAALVRYSDEAPGQAE